jgi:hypothetical protein
MEEEEIAISDLKSGAINDILLKTMLNSDVHLHLVMKQGAEGVRLEIFQLKNAAIYIILAFFRILQSALSQFHSNIEII